jgi:hypothetical protein
MYCLYCGDCCKRMSPITGNGDPCPRLITKGSLHFCSTYNNRPSECENHKFSSRFCPIGIDMLKLSDIEDIRKRIDDGWKIIMENTNEPR